MMGSCCSLRLRLRLSRVPKGFAVGVLADRRIDKLKSDCVSQGKVMPTEILSQYK